MSVEQYIACYTHVRTHKQVAHNYTRQTNANSSNIIGCNIDNFPAALPVDPPGETAGVVRIMVVVEVEVIVTCAVEVGDTIVAVTIATGCEVVTQMTSMRRSYYLKH